MKRETITKILVIRFSSLGDVILTTPLLRLLRNSFPASEIHYLTKKSYTELILSNPNVDKTITIGDELNFNGLRLLTKQLSLNSYDCIIDLHNNLRTFYLKLFLRWKSDSFTFKKYSFRKLLLVKFKLNLMKDLQPINSRYIETIKSLKLLPRIYLGRNDILPEIFTNDEAKKKIEELLFFSANTKLICIVPSSKHFTKTYPPDYFIELINKFNKEKYSFVLIGKGDDKKNIREIKSKTDKNVYDFCDKLNAIELLEMMKRCWLVISGDTGPMHIAEAANVPLIMIAGSSVKEFGFYPQSENSVVIENKTLDCRPCSHIGRNECPKGHFKCMKELTPESVYNLILKN